jgi:hypothetical protein
MIVGYKMTCEFLNHRDIEKKSAVGSLSKVLIRLYLVAWPMVRKHPDRAGTQILAMTIG